MLDLYILVGKTPILIPSDQFLAWSLWFGESHRNMARTHIEPQKPLRKGNARMLKIINHRRAQSVTVYTSFLGIDHNYCGGEPILFETWVDGGRQDSELIRYCTFDDAIANHNRIITTNLK